MINRVHFNLLSLKWAPVCPVKSRVVHVAEFLFGSLNYAAISLHLSQRFRVFWLKLLLAGSKTHLLTHSSCSGARITLAQSLMLAWVKRHLDHVSLGGWGVAVVTAGILRSLVCVCPLPTIFAVFMRGYIVKNIKAETRLDEQLRLKGRVGLWAVVAT